MADPTNTHWSPNMAPRSFDTYYDDVPWGLLLTQPDKPGGRDTGAERIQYNLDRTLNALAHTVGMKPVRQLQQPAPPSFRAPGTLGDWPTNLSLLLESTPVAAARDVLQSSKDLERSWKANDREGFVSAGAGGLLAAMGLVPGGRLAKVLAPVGKEVAPYLQEGVAALTRNNRRGLPMDLVSQQTRGLEQRFGLNRRLYHAGKTRFFGLDPRKTDEGAVTLTTSAPMADSYIGEFPVPSHLAEPGALRSSIDPNLSRAYFMEHVYPIVLRDWDKFLTFDRGGKSYDRNLVQRALAEARSMRAPGVVFENMRDPGPATRFFDLPDAELPATVVYLLKTNYARSPFATFDPLRMESRNLLDGLVPVASIGMLAPFLPSAEKEP
jgi:hypothetical protein